MLSILLQCDECGEKLETFTSQPEKSSIYLEKLLEWAKRRSWAICLDQTIGVLCPTCRKKWRAKNETHS